jgi:hypothetical protein
MNPLANLDISLRTSEPSPVPVLHPLGNSDFKIRIDNSTLDIIKSCPREASFYVLHRRGRGTTPAMNMGTAIHKALEFLYRNGFTNENLTTAYHLIDQHYLVQPFTDEWRGPEFAKQSIQQYFQKVGSGPFEIINTPDGNPFIEVPFEIELGKVEVNAELPFSFKHLTGQTPPAGMEEDSKTYIKNLLIYIIGKIDLAVNQLNGLWTLDHKTASRLGETFWDKFTISPQFKTYCWALWKITNILPLGAIVNVLVVRKPTKTGTAIDFQRQAYQYSESLLLEWEQNTLATISNFIACAIAESFPPNDSNCIRIYGKCPYFNVCSLPIPNRLPFLYTSEYAPVTWDPTNEDPS